ncbi:MAG: alpha/beta hydrolase [Roseibacillus sp.]
MKRRLIAIPLIIILLVCIIFIQTASNRIISPERARLREVHHQILAEPTEHGMTITSHTAPDGTPYLLCLGLNITGEKGRILRKQLHDRQVSAHQKPAAILLLHGHASRKEHHLAIAERFCAVGFTCLIPDLPGHGENPQKIATFGKNEVPSLLQLVSYFQEEHSLPDNFGIFGLSQGGAIALQLAAADNSSFHSVASISTFAHLSNTIKRTADKKSPLLATLVPAVQFDLRVRHNLDLHEISPAQAASRINLPVFIAHGKNDTFIPPSNAKEIYQNLPHPEKRLRLIPEAGHGNVLAKGDLIYADLCEFYLNASQQ